MSGTINLTQVPRSGKGIVLLFLALVAFAVIALLALFLGKKLLALVPLGGVREAAQT